MDRSNVTALAENLLSLGSEVRQLRKARGLTLKQLSEAASVSVSHVSAIERGTTNPSMDALTALASALEVTLDWFFARRPGAGPMERAYVVRRQNRRSLHALYGEEEHELGYSDSLLSSTIGGPFYMGLAVYSPDGGDPDAPLYVHDGEQHGLVIEGELELRIGDEVITLFEGDSYSFHASVPHTAYNRSDRPCRLVWAVSPVIIPKNVPRHPRAPEQVAE